MASEFRKAAAPERILVVDDSRELRIFLSKDMLPQLGYKTLSAANGEQGLRLIVEKQPDLVMLDLQLPDRSGLDVLQEMRERQIQVPVILMTAHGSESVAVEAFRQGINDYLPKPFDIGVAHKMIERLLEQTRLQREKERLRQELEHARRDLEQRVRELTVLFGVSKSVTSLLELDKLLTRVVEAAVFITKAEEGALWLLEGEGGDLVLRAEKNLGTNRARLLHLHSPDSMVSQVFQELQPVRVVSHAGESGMKIKTDYLARALLSVPLVDKGQSIGVLSVANRTQSSAFSANHETLLQFLADYAAIAITNARLYAEIRAFSQELEAKVRERTQELREFVSVVYHELNTPITAINGYTAMLLDGKAGALDEQQAHFLSIAQNNTQRLMRLVADLSDVSKIEDGRLSIRREIVDLRQAVDEMVRSLANLVVEKDLELDINLAPDALRVQGDPQRVAQILSNLVGNACRYTPRGGQVSIASRRTDDFVETTVSDTGIGIREDELERIFERFYRSDDSRVRDQSGTGLGLAISRSLVELHGGRLWVKSQIGEGSTFGFTLPQAEAVAHES